MSQVKKPPSIFRRLREPRALNYLIMAGAGLVVYGLMLSSYGSDAGALIACLIGVAGILARWTIAPILIMLLTAYMLLDPGFGNVINYIANGRWFMPRSSGNFQLEDLILAAGLLAYTIGHYRLTSMIFQGMPDEPTVRRDIDPKDPPKRLANLVRDDEWIRALLAGGGTLVIGQLAWFVIVFAVRLSRPNATEFTLGLSRLLFLVWVTGLVLLGVSAALVYLRSLRMSRHEAALILRDQFFHENMRETDRLHRWRQWYKLRVATRRHSGK